MNAPFVRTAIDAQDAPKWWQDPRMRDALRLLLGAAVVLALVFGVLRPALRQISDPAPAIARKKGQTKPQAADVSVLQDDDPMLALAEDTASIDGHSAAIALPDAYEERLRLAREAVKADSKRVAQVVKGWVANEA
jgi:flagellar M-ring protein FliF